MSRQRAILSLAGETVLPYLPAILLQALTVSALNVFFMLVQPLLMQALFAALEAGALAGTFRECARYGAALAAGFGLCYLNNVILDVNAFRVYHSAVCSLFSRWHRLRGEHAPEGIVFQDITAGAMSLGALLPDAVQVLFSVFALAFLLVFSAGTVSGLPFVLGVVFVLFLWLNVWQYKMVRDRENEEQQALGNAEADARLLFQEIGFLDRYALVEKEQKAYEKQRERAWKARFSKAKGQTWADVLASLLTGAAYLWLFLSAALKEGGNPAAMAGLAAAVSLIQSAAGNAAELLTRMRALTSALVPLRRAAAFLCDKPGGRTPCLHRRTFDGQRTETEAPDYRKAAVEIFCDVSGEADRGWKTEGEGLRRIEIREGEHVAVIGKNGSGKSTLLNRIAGLPCQDQGAQIRVYGGDPACFSFEKRRECISIAPKEDQLFQVSAAENIRMSLPVENGNIRKETIWQGDMRQWQGDMRQGDIRRRNMRQENVRKENGRKNRADAKFEETNRAFGEVEQRLEELASAFDAEPFLSVSAKKLSGGQARRTGLMRACMHPAKILLADEPTASLDRKNADQAMKALHQRAGQGTLIAVTHDSEYLSGFDRILLMENLEPVFAGTFEELKKTRAYERWLAAE